MASAFELRTLLDLAPIPLVVVDHAGEIQLANLSAARMFGYEQAELLGREVGLLIPESLRGVHEGHVDEWFSDPRPRLLGSGRGLVGRRKDGTELRLEISLQPVDTRSGTWAIAAVRDVSARLGAIRERERLQEELREAHSVGVVDAQLSQAGRLETVGQLAGGLAHDFNNILGVIINYSRFAAEQLEPDSQPRKDIEQVRQAAERGVGLARQLLIFSRREIVPTEVFDLNELVSQMESLLERTLGEDIELIAACAEDLWPIKGDRAQIEQVLVNLALNSRDAMREGGTLRIETANVVLDEHHGRLHPNVAPGHYVSLTVSDTGAGMDAEIAARAFEPFFSTKPKGEGTGLGLAMVYGVVTQAGGTVTLSSEPGIGTSVVVHLPATGEVPREREGGLPTPRARDETVLVVEDDESVRRMTQRILERAGYSVLSAESGASALDIIDEQRNVDLLLTDVVMPRMSGTELSKRAVVMNPSLRVLLMSGYADRAPAPDPKLDGGAEFISKPFQPEELLERVREVLDR
jgi:PAS domain S-box-containing protein